MALALVLGVVLAFDRFLAAGHFGDAPGQGQAVCIQGGQRGALRERRPAVAMLVQAGVEVLDSQPAFS